jgi:hypothetical protein
MAYKAPGILLEGPTGSGKTTSACTLARANISTRFILTEPFADVIAKYESDHGLKPCTDGGLLHYHEIPVASGDFATMIKNAQLINSMNFETLSKLKSGMNKDTYGQFINLLETLSNYTCQRCNENFGAVDDWTTDTALVLDGLSGLSQMAMDLVVGAKPTKAVGEWGVAMDNLERLINKLATDLTCWFVLLAHIERETDEITGGLKLMTSTLGRKLAPRIPRYFHEVILCVHNGREYNWSTTEVNVDLKHKLLPMSDKLEASFVPLVTKWKQITRQAPTKLTASATSSLLKPQAV